MPEMKTLTIGGQEFTVVDQAAVHFTKQNLTEEQQAQARENLGITSSDVVLATNKSTMDASAFTQTMIKAGAVVPCLFMMDYDAEAKTTALSGKHISKVNFLVNTAGTITFGTVDLNTVGQQPVFAQSKTVTADQTGMVTMYLDMDVGENETLAFHSTTDTGGLAYLVCETGGTSALQFWVANSFKNNTPENSTLYGTIYSVPSQGGGGGEKGDPGSDGSGINLYTGTADFSGKWNNLSYWENSGLTDSYGNAVYRYTTPGGAGMFQKIAAKAGETFTLSASVRTDNGLQHAMFTVMEHGSNYSTITSATQECGLIGTGEVRVSMTYTCQNDCSLAFYLSPYNRNGVVEDNFYISSLKMECGAVKQTRWCKAIADIKDGQPGKNGNPGEPGQPGYTPQKGIDYFDGKDGTNGKDGVSVTVHSVSESTADGGSNVVTFSDGKSVTIKNGRRGETGTTGSKGDTGDTGAGINLWTGTADFSKDLNGANWYFLSDWKNYYHSDFYSNETYVGTASSRGIFKRIRAKAGETFTYSANIRTDNGGIGGHIYAREGVIGYSNKYHVADIVKSYGTGNIGTSREDPRLFASYTCQNDCNLEMFFQPYGDENDHVYISSLKLEPGTVRQTTWCPSFEDIEKVQKAQAEEIAGLKNGYTDLGTLNENIEYFLNEMAGTGKYTFRIAADDMSYQYFLDVVYGEDYDPRSYQTLWSTQHGLSRIYYRNGDGGGADWVWGNWTCLNDGFTDLGTMDGYEPDGIMEKSQFRNEGKYKFVTLNGEMVTAIVEIAGNHIWQTYWTDWGEAEDIYRRSGYYSTSGRKWVFTKWKRYATQDEVKALDERVEALEENGGGSGGANVLTVTLNEDGLPNVTMAEVYNHCQNGGQVVLEDNNGIHHCNAYGEEYVRFSWVDAEESRILTCHVTDDGSEQFDTGYNGYGDDAMYIRVDRSACTASEGSGQIHIYATSGANVFIKETDGSLYKPISIKPNCVTYFDPNGADGIVTMVNIYSNGTTEDNTWEMV